MKEAGAEGLSFELLNRNVDQRFNWPVVRHNAQRKFDVVLEANEPRRSMQKYLPASVDSENYGHYEDQKEIDLYKAMLHAADLPTQHALMHDFEKSGLGGTLARPKACCAAPDRVIHGYSAHRDGEQRCGRGSTIGFIGGWATAIRVI